MNVPHLVSGCIMNGFNVMERIDIWVLEFSDLNEIHMLYMKRLFKYLLKFIQVPHSYRYDLCICNHTRKIHGELYLGLRTFLAYEKEKPYLAYGCYADDNLRCYCSCIQFKMDNLKTLEARYDRQLIKW